MAMETGHPLLPDLPARPSATSARTIRRVWKLELPGDPLTRVLVLKSGTRI